MAQYWRVVLLIFCLSFVSFSANSSNTVSNSLVIEVKKGDTLVEILKSSGVSRNHAVSVIEELKKLYNPSRLKIGQKLRLNLDIKDIEGQHITINSLTIRISPTKNVQVKHIGNNRFKAQILNIATKTKLEVVGGSIKSSLYAAASKQNIPNVIMAQFIKIFSYDVDFQRDIRRGDKFEIVYEQVYSQENEKVATGNVIRATLVTRGNKLNVYRYSTSTDRTDYFDENGKAVRKSLLRTPIDGARVTSSYGRRRHPILGYTKIHKGIDFGAPRGTPIYAAGDGKVVKIGRNGGYGKYIKIRHNNKYSTAYAHLNRYAKKVRKGTKVKQGQIIGYVGSTGRSTGPHLHYEVMINNRHVNPLKVKSVSGLQLRGVKLAIFKKYKASIDKVATIPTTIVKKVIERNKNIPVTTPSKRYIVPKSLQIIR